MLTRVPIVAQVSVMSSVMSVMIPVIRTLMMFMYA